MGSAMADEAREGDFGGFRDRDFGDRYGDYDGRSRDWTLLGEARVDGRRDRDVVYVGKDGGFRSLRVVVDGSDLQMRDMVVTFGDGTSFSPPLRDYFREGARTREIDLPGERRRIETIELRYGNLPGGGAATVQIFGRGEPGFGPGGGRPDRRGERHFFSLPAVRSEIARHEAQVARLERMLQRAQSTRWYFMARRARVQLEAENARHERRMRALRLKFAATAGNRFPG
jgi:hypothetical protein